MSQLRAGPGRPMVSTPRQVAEVAIRLFREQGYECTTVADVAAAAGVSERTVYRYFGSKSDMYWWDFDHELDRIRQALAARPGDEPVLVALRNALVEANQFREEEVEHYRDRYALLQTVPDIQAAGAPRFAQWRALVADFAARRWGMPASDIRIRALAHAGLAVGTAAVELWLESGQGNLGPVLASAWTALDSRFTDAGPPTGLDD